MARALKASPPQQHPPATVVSSRIVHPGREQEFEAWARKAEAVFRQTEGHLGSVRLQQQGGLYHLVYQFDSHDHLRLWENSEQRRRLLQEADSFSELQRDVAIGYDAWFAVSGQSASPRWKTALATWTAVYPTLLLLNYGLKTLLPHLWQPAQLALSSMVLTASLTWLIMPQVSKLLRPWLLRGASSVRARR